MSCSTATSRSQLRKTDRDQRQEVFSAFGAGRGRRSGLGLVGAAAVSDLASALVWAPWRKERFSRFWASGFCPSAFSPGLVSGSAGGVGSGLLLSTFTFRLALTSGWS